MGVVQDHTVHSWCRRDLNPDSIAVDMESVDHPATQSPLASIIQTELQITVKDLPYLITVFE